MTNRVGENSYGIEIKPGVTIGAHANFLKPYREDILVGKPVPLFYHRRTTLDSKAQPNEWIVEKKFVA